MAVLPLCIVGAPLYLIIQPSRRGQIVRRCGVGLDCPELKKTKTIWIHALSVGEVTSAYPLVRELARTRGESVTIIFSASTRSGRQLAARQLGPFCDAIIYFPFDIAPVITYFLRKIDPDLFILIETDFWPNFIHFTQKAGIPMLLFNGRVSDGSMAKYRRFGFFFRPLFEAFELLCMQTSSDGEKMQALGISPDKIRSIGNLKFSEAIDTSSDQANRSPLLPENHFLIFGGSTHAGEETILVESFLLLKTKHADLHLVLAPRDIKRSDELIQMIQSKALTARRLSAPSAEPADITVIDTIGDLARLYRYASISFVGGSLVAEGGHNPLEAARFGCPVLFGPHMDDFKEISSGLVEAGGALIIHNKDGFSSAVDQLIADEQRRRRIGTSAKRYTERYENVLTEHLQVIDCYL
ncbi:MAG: glycosyltransferase N-terminal domain-containing protein [Desulfuromonadales bacterium]